MEVVYARCSMLAPSSPLFSIPTPPEAGKPLFPHDSFWHQFRELVSPLINDEDYSCMYCPNRGRPAKSPAMLTIMDIDDLVEYIADQACLPQIIEDTSREVTWEKCHYMGEDPYWEGRGVKMPIVKIYLPIIPSERLGPVLI